MSHIWRAAAGRPGARYQPTLMLEESASTSVVSDKCRFENPLRSGTLCFPSDVLQIGLKPRQAASVEQPWCGGWIV